MKNKKYKSFLISKLFNVSGTITTHPKKLKQGGENPRITCSSTNNGIDNFYLNKPTETGGVLTVDSAAVGYVAYQEKDFIATDHVEKIFFKDRKIKKSLGLSLVTCIRGAIKNKYNYGYKFSQERIKKQKIMLPINDKFEPDYKYMEQYTDNKINEKLENYKNYVKTKLKNIEYKEIERLEVKEWKNFKIDKVFNIESGKDIYEKERKLGELPYITATGANNGIGYFVSNRNNSMDSNAISVNRNGSVGFSFFHKYEALYSNDCRKLKLKIASNEYISLFLTNQIMQQKEKYSYGYKLGTARLKKQYIILPCGIDGEPDYDYMEQYIKNLIYKKTNQYLEYLKYKEENGENNVKK